jgi:glycosyltransferase involved in cell wall biosynthesis
MVIECAPRPAGWEVMPNRDSQLLRHSKHDSLCQDVSVKIGVDFRGAQGGSGQRGIGRYTLELVRGILDYAPRGTEVILFCRHDAEIPVELRGRVREVKVTAPSWSDDKKPLWLKIPKIRSTKYFHEVRFSRARRKQERAIERCLNENPIDILIIPSALDVGSYPIFRYPCPVLMTMLDAIIIALKETMFARYPWFLQSYYHEQAENLKRADRVLAISQATADDGVKFFDLDPARIDVVYPAVSREYGVERARPARVWNFDYFLFCSVPDPHKNPEVTLSAFARVDTDAHLVFISPEDQNYAPKLRKLAEDLGVKDRFHITGFVPEEEMYGLFQHATALVSPSQMEGFGYPVAQAMRAGTPVITSNISAQAEIAVGIGYLVDPNSPDEIAEGMRAALRGEIKGEDGRERSTWFDSEAVTRKLFDSIRQVTGSEE